MPNPSARGAIRSAGQPRISGAATTGPGHFLSTALSAHAGRYETITVPEPPAGQGDAHVGLGVWRVSQSGSGATFPPRFAAGRGAIWGFW